MEVNEAYFVQAPLNIFVEAGEEPARSGVVVAKHPRYTGEILEKVITHD